MNVKTTELRQVMLKASKGAGYNSFIPMTNFCRIKEIADTFSISTTDGVSIFTVTGETCEGLPCAKLDIVVELATLLKLINTFTSDEVVIFTARDILIVEADGGKYKMNIPLDENDAPIKFPDIERFEDNHTTIYADIIRDIIKTNKSALPNNTECPELNGYIFSDGVITTDTLVVCKNLYDVHMIKSPDDYIMFNPSVLEILSLFDDCIEVYHRDNCYLFIDDNMKYQTYLSEYQDDFPIDAINNLFELEFDKCFEVNRTELYNALRRVSFFVSPYDANTCTLIISKDSLTVKNRLETGIETIPIVCDTVSEHDILINVNINMLMNQLKPMLQKVTFYYGSDRCIELRDELTTRIIAIQEVSNID